MPVTHSKHVRLSCGSMTGFETYMTGELFAHLHEMATLRDALSLLEAVDPDNSWFARGARAASGQGFLNALFTIRARRLLHDVRPADGTAFLSGLLIGTELLQIPRQVGVLPEHLLEVRSFFGSR